MIERISTGRKPAYRALTYGTIKNRRDLRQSGCLVRIREQLKDVIAKYNPEVCAVEGVIFVQSYKTAITMGAARGAAVLAAAEHGMEIFEYAPRRVKQAVVGRGGADKQQVAFMMRALLELHRDTVIRCRRCISDRTGSFLCARPRSGHFDQGQARPALAMKPLDDMRTTLVVQALEQSDPGEVVLQDEDKREVGMAAGAPLAKNLSTSEENAFLAERAGLLALRATTRFPEETRWFRRDPNHHRLNWLAIGLCLLAVVIGFLTNELGPDKRINILSFPLLGLIVWSLIVYVRELILFFQNRDRLFRDGWLQGLIRFVQPKIKKPDSNLGSEAAGILRVASQIFADRWREMMTPVTGARVKSLLHLVAFLLAASAIAGMYVKGLANEYLAVWESTFFEEGSDLRPFLKVVLGPAAQITGDEIPTTTELDAIHWKSGQSGSVAGENAARWIHWYAITVGIFVLIPRLALSFIWRWRGSRLLRTLPFRKVFPQLLRKYTLDFIWCRP